MQPKVHVIPNDKMLQNFYNPNNVSWVYEDVFKALALVGIGLGVRVSYMVRVSFYGQGLGIGLGLGLVLGSVLIINYPGHI